MRFETAEKLFLFRFSGPAQPVLPTTQIQTTFTSVLIDTNNSVDPVTVPAGRIDNYVLAQSSADMTRSFVSRYDENMNITGLQPGTQYNFTFLSQIEECGGFNGTAELSLLNVCTGKNLFAFLADFELRSSLRLF